MSLPDESFLIGEIFEEGPAVSVHELTRMFAVEERRIVEWVEEGVISVLETNTAQWRFSGAQLRRARIALRLERDLDGRAGASPQLQHMLVEVELNLHHIQPMRGGYPLRRNPNFVQLDCHRFHAAHSGFSQGFNPRI